MRVLFPKRRRFVDVEMFVTFRDSSGGSVDECFDERRLRGAGEQVGCAFDGDFVVVVWLDYRISSSRRRSMEDNTGFDGG